jgi:hypothetical protein
MTHPIVQDISEIKSNRIILLGFLFLAIYLFNINITSANTGINPQIPYSGTIVKNDGTLLEGSYRAKFILYDASSAGTVIYEEIRDGVTNYAGTGVSPLLSISDGRFEILLGSQNTAISTINDDSLWLELQLDMDNNSSYEEIFAPRKRIGSALSAINSMRLVAANGGTSTNTLSLDSTGHLVFTGDSATERMRITGAGAITASALGGGANASTPSGFDRVLLANISGQFSQLSLGALWSVFGNNTISAWNGSAGSFLGTTSEQPLVLATTNATAQDIRFFTGANGANERIRILGTGNVGIGTTTPQARLDVNGGIRVGNEDTNCTSSNIGTLRYNNGGLQVCRAEGWSYLQCPTGYIKVPGNSLYQTKDFCVMKYEAKTGSATVAATTEAAGTPTVNITQTNAISACNANNTGGATGYGLINNREWMTIARNIEAQSVNWTGGAVGSGGLWRGHSDVSPYNALAANTNDSLGYEGTGNTSPSIEKRTHSLSNGEVIWDLSGNVWEWTSDTIQGQDKPNNSSGNLWQEWTDISNFGTLSYDLTRPSNPAWNTAQNMGQYQAGTVTGTTTFPFLRGGNWAISTSAGVFALNLNNTPAYTGSGIGFRCVVR